MPPAEKAINQRYINLLSETFEKYKIIDIMSSKIKDDDNEKHDMVNETVEKVCPGTHNLGPKRE